MSPSSACDSLACSPASRAFCDGPIAKHFCRCLAACGLVGSLLAGHGRADIFVLAGRRAGPRRTGQSRRVAPQDLRDQDRQRRRRSRSRPTRSRKSNGRPPPKSKYDQIRGQLSRHGRRAVEAGRVVPRKPAAQAARDAPGASRSSWTPIMPTRGTPWAIARSTAAGSRKKR